MAYLLRLRRPQACPKIFEGKQRTQKALSRAALGLPDVRAPTAVRRFSAIDAAREVLRQPGKRQLIWETS